MTKIKRASIYVVIGYAVFDESAAIILLPFAIVLVPVVFVENRLATRIANERLAIDHIRRALLRVEGGWVGIGDSGARYLQKDELFADDLDIFGRGSLFQFLCTANTSAGKNVLADWLRNPAEAELIVERHRAIQDLKTDLDLREQLAVNEPDIGSFRPEAVAQWSATPELFSQTSSRVTGMIIAYTLFASLSLKIIFGQGTVFLACAFSAELLFYLRFRTQVRAVGKHVHHVMTTVPYLSEVAGKLRNKPFTSLLLNQIRSSLLTESGTLFRFSLFAYGVLGQFPVFLCLICQAVPACERWRRRTGELTLGRLKSLGEFEALVSLSQYAYEQTSATYPEIVSDEACFDAEQLGHPLISSAARVTNDVSLANDRRLLLVSGSNMSGKSTMLRTVGINTVLALAGAPVCASKLRVSRFSIGTAMRFQDSLEDNTSLFYAVIERLCSVTELLQSEHRPLLFLIDEILQGTNSRDRLAGAEAVIRKLVNGGAIGMVTTHDLELTRIVEGLGTLAGNVHFVDKVVDGKLTFDYKMRPGVVETSNALLLMRNMGLDV